MVRDFEAREPEVRKRARQKIEDPEILEEVMLELVETIPKLPLDDVEPDAQDATELALVLEDVLSKQLYYSSLKESLKDAHRRQLPLPEGVAQLYVAFAYWYPVLAQLNRNLNQRVALLDSSGNVLWKFLIRILHKIDGYRAAPLATLAASAASGLHADLERVSALAGKLLETLEHLER